MKTVTATINVAKLNNLISHACAAAAQINEQCAHVGHNLMQTTATIASGYKLNEI